MSGPVKMSLDDSEVEMVSPFGGIRSSLKDKIYYAAKDGHAISVMAALNDIEDPSMRTCVLNQIFEESDRQCLTPLAAAANFGRYNVVKALLANYNVDIEKECTVKFDGHMVHGATTLWCAAGAGYLNVVKLLIKHGANVNHRTKAHSTPLRAACFEGRLDIVRYLVMHGADVQLANVYNNTCLMISAYKGHTAIVEFLLNSGAYPNEQALCGATALHYAAECGHVEICEMLLDFSAALLKNEFGLTAVLTAAERTHEAIIDLFSYRPNLLTKEEIIEALELMGASFANDKDNYNVNKAYQYLLKAMELRYEDSDNIIRKKLIPSIPAFDNWIESQTIQDLQAIRLNNNSIHMEALTIRERILRRTYPDLPQPIVFRGAVYADHGRFDRCEGLWIYAMKLRQSNRVSVERDLLRFAQLYSQMIHIEENVSLVNIIDVLSSAVEELNLNRDIMTNPGPKDDVSSISEGYQQNILTTLYLLTIVTKVLKVPNQRIQASDLSNLYKIVFTLNKMNIKLRDGQTLLHLAVNGVTPVDEFHTNDVCRFPCVDIVKLLLHCGADILAVDCDRNTPLHILSSTFQMIIPPDNEMLNTLEEITNIFVEAGSHLDSVNKNGLTAAQVAPLFIVESIIKKYETQFTSLKCLSSRCIAQQKITYKGLVPKQLEKFIQIHSADKL